MAWSLRLSSSRALARCWNLSLMSVHTWAENKVRSMSPFSWELARSSRRKSPWGRTMTWENCSQLKWSSSSARRRTALSLPLSSRTNSPCSRRKHWWLSRGWGSLVFRLTRRKMDRRKRYSSPWREKSNSTTVGWSWPALMQRMEEKVLRPPVARQYRAKHMASSREVFPPPVGPVMRNSPVSVNWVKSSSVGSK